MLRSSRLRCLLALGSLALASCSLQGLDRFQFPECSTDPLHGCDSLNARDNVRADACALWQCGDHGSCTFGPRDLDGDDHVAASCTGGDDCNDADPQAHPGLAEVCDGSDNDCNGIVDDDVTTTMTLEPTTVVTDTGAVDNIAFASRHDGAVALWSSGSATLMARVSDLVASTPVPIDGETNEMPYSPYTYTPAVGCPGISIDPQLPTPCPSGTCAVGICVTRGDGVQICEPTVQPRRAGRPALPGTPCTAHWQCDDGIFCDGIETCEPDSDDVLIDDRGCRGYLTADRQPPLRDRCSGQLCLENYDVCVASSASHCTFGSLAADALGLGDELLFVGGDSTGTCAIVRPGLLDTALATPRIAFIGGDAYSTVWRGIGGDPTHACTTARATGIDVAALPPTSGGGFATGLVAYRAGANDGSSAPIEVTGLWREQSSIGTEVHRFVNGTGNGAPLALATPTTGLPHVAAFAQGTAGGFVVASPRAGGGVSLAAIAALGAPSCSATDYPRCVFTTGADGNPQTALTIDPPMLDGGGGDADAGVASPGTTLRVRSTPALGTPVESVLASSETVPAEVLVAAGPDRGGASAQIALAWASATEIVVATADVDTATLAAHDTATPIRIPVAGATSLALVHVEAGIALAGAFGGTTIGADETGGYVLTWVAGGSTWAARISDHSHALVGSAVRLGTASVAARAIVDYDDLNNAHLRVIANQGTRLVVFPSVCGPTS